MLQILKKFSNDGAHPRNTCTALSLGLTYVVYHSHEYDYSEPCNGADPLLTMITQNLSDTLDEVVWLLQTLSYWAHEVDNETVVLEESVRDSFTAYLQRIAPTVFSDVLNYWA